MAPASAASGHQRVDRGAHAEREQIHDDDGVDHPALGGEAVAGDVGDVGVPRRDVRRRHPADNSRRKNGAATARVPTAQSRAQAAFRKQEQRPPCKAGGDPVLV